MYVMLNPLFYREMKVLKYGVNMKTMCPTYTL